MLNRKISQDESVAKLSIKATLLYTWLIPHADIRGRLYGDQVYLKGNIIPHVNEIKIVDIERLLSEMVEANLIIYYGDKVKYIQLCGWENNQTLYADREAKSEIPAPTEELMRNSCVTHGEEKRSKEKLSKENIYTPEFEEIYKLYPNQDSKKQAFKHFNASVKTPKQIEDIKKALKNYIAHLKAETWKKPKSASTWFNNWQDWINYNPEGKHGKSDRGKYDQLEDGSEPAGI